MQSGDILLFKGEEKFSRLIQWGTNSKYSHAAVSACSSMNLAIEANTRGGVRAIDTRRIKVDYDIYRVKEEYLYDLDGTISYLVSKLNSRYDYLGVIYLGFLKLLQKLGIPTQRYANEFQKKRDYFCSELCYEAFSIGGGLDIVPQIAEAEVTSPADIARSPVIELITSQALQPVYV